MWRFMTPNDLKRVYRISLAQWGMDNYESIDIFEDKLTRYPQGCFVYEIDNQIKGYLFSHPWNSNMIPQLNTPLPELYPESYDCYFIHDIVLVPELRGLGIANQILKIIFENNETIYLVATVPTQYYWKKKYDFVRTMMKCDYGIHMVKT